MSRRNDDKPWSSRETTTGKTSLSSSAYKTVSAKREEEAEAKMKRANASSSNPPSTSYTSSTSTTTGRPPSAPSTAPLPTIKYRSTSAPLTAEPDVEKYLNKTRMISNIRKERLLAQQQHSRKSSEEVPPPPNHAAKQDIFRMNHPSTSSSNRPSIQSERHEEWMKRVRAIRKVGKAYETAARKVKEEKEASAHPFGETEQTTNQAVKGWSTYSLKKQQQQRAVVEPAPVSAPSEVSEYLKMRKSHDEKDTTTPNISRQVSNATSEEDDSSSEDEQELERRKRKRQSLKGSPPYYSVKVCVISAVDFPTNVVPNLPFSPILKLAITPLADGIEGRKRKVMDTLETNGIHKLDGARIQSLTSKILTKRDNGSVEFHEELRWDDISSPDDMALAIELSARAVMRPANVKESPPAQKVQPLSFQNSIGRGTTGRAQLSKTTSDQSSVVGSLFRRNKNSEIETANAAAAVAKLLVDGEEPKEKQKNHSDIDVKLRSKKRKKKTRMTEDLRIGSQVIPLSKIALSRAIQEGQTVRVEQWFDLESSMNATRSKAGSRNPSVLLEISFTSPEAMDESEDDMDDEIQPEEKKISFSKRASLKIRQQQKQEISKEAEEEKVEEPVLDPGIIDYICVVGARDIGNQKSDDGSSGWVNSSPECCILEQFPPNDDFHFENGRHVVLPNKVEWWCFPEGCRLWRGNTPPNSEELNLNRFSASSPANIATTLASFDACLGCTTSFTWFVIASNSDEFGSDTVKTYGACIRFFVPAPPGIDQTQADFAQLEAGSNDKMLNMERKRLWVPLGICMTSNMPIIGIMEVLLLRLCESLMQTGLPKTAVDIKDIYDDLTNLIVNFQKPIPGVVQTSFPFLGGDRISIALPPRSGLPAIPHGRAITSVCRLLGADGITYLMAALLTECKILLHSDDVANLCLVAEVMTALLYPFTWSLPYIPVLPVEMTEFLEAPLSFLLGIPSCNLNAVDPLVLEEIVVIDLDHDFVTNDYFEGKRVKSASKTPTPLPANTVNNISRAVHRLLRAEEEMETAAQTSPHQRQFPRAEPESLAEREFRIAVAIEMFSLIRGYQDCLVYAASSPVFNAEKFLQNAPALFEEQRVGPSGHAATLAGPRRVLSPRSRRFLSLLVTCQHFHQWLETLDREQTAFFHEIVSAMSMSSKRRSPFSTDRTPTDNDRQRAIDSLLALLRKQEDRIPMYRVRKVNESVSLNKVDGAIEFPMQILQNIKSAGTKADASSSSESGVTKLSMDFLVELEKNPWRYTKILDLAVKGEDCIFQCEEKVKLRDALGERKYRAWKMSLDHEGDDFSVISDETKRPRLLSGEIVNITVFDDKEEPDSEHHGKVRSVEQVKADKVDCDTIRKCFEIAEDAQTGETTAESDIVTKAETALKNPAARRYLISVLSKRNEARADETLKEKSSGARLEKSSFDVLLRLGKAVLNWCTEDHDYETAYSLLKLTAGLHVVQTDTNTQVFLTTKIVQHPFYADLRLWERVQAFMVASRKQQRAEESKEEDSAEPEFIDEEKDEYEAVVGTLYEMLGYGMPTEDLARFAWRMTQKKGWFTTERGQSIMILVRRLHTRREHGDSSKNVKKDYLESFSIPWKNDVKRLSSVPAESTWKEISWCHPAAQSARRQSSASSTPSRTGRLSSAPLTQTDEQTYAGIKKTGSSYMQRTAVTALAYLGSGVIVSGGLDGGVFMARLGEGDAGEPGVRGVHLDWGSSGSRYAVGSSTSSIDGEYGVGAVSCLASTTSATNPFLDPSDNRRKPMTPLDDEDLLKSMESCRVVAGTTCGDLRVWSVKDVFTAIFYSEKGGDFLNHAEQSRNVHGSGEGATSSFISSRRRLTAEISAGSSLTRLKFSLRGRALSGHRGGVSCIDVPSNSYRPDSVVSGGADGLIKLWSLRSPAVAGRRAEGETGRHALLSPTAKASPSSAPARSGDALSILSGHGGRVLCIKTAWHGDRLLSGGADRTVRVWDLAGSGGKCLNSLSGHFGWVTHVQYWGSNVIVSASTDRSLAVWDSRVAKSPLFSLRHHCAPISDVLVGSRTDPTMLSAASDGTVAAWDFRRLGTEAKPLEADSPVPCTVIRKPDPVLRLDDLSYQDHLVGPVHLARGPSLHGKTAYSLGSDAIIREWDSDSGGIVSEHITGHCDAISKFVALRGDRVADGELLDAMDERVSGTLSASWDGTVRMRCAV